MSVLKKSELMEKLKALIGDRTDDEALTFIEDVSDTVEANKSEEDWKTKYEENDKMWREKYRDRFYNGNDENDDDTDDKKDTKNEDTDGEEKPLTYENLFKEEWINGNKENCYFYA